jgi:coenzyme Q-binding protein COQ10
LECTNDVERTIRKQEEGGMPRHEEQKTLAYTADELFSVVADVKDYPSFIPWCSGARIHREDPQEIIADLEIGFGPFRESFTSQVALDRPRQVLVRATEGGPLEHLTNTWTFTPAGAGTQVDFVIDFQFKSHLLDHLANSMFHEAATKMMGAFEARAHLVHIMKQRRLHSSS